ncbi:hypothetical protein [Persephonella sp.]
MSKIYLGLLTIIFSSFIYIGTSFAEGDSNKKDIKQLNIGKPCCSNCDDKKAKKPEKSGCPNCAEVKKPCCKDG